MTIAIVAGAWILLPQSAFGVVAALGVVVAVGAAGLGLAHGELEGEFARVQRGDGVLARWTLTPDQWRTFLEERSALEMASKIRPAPLHTPRNPPASGMEVIITKGAVYVGGTYTPVVPAYLQMPTVHRACLEFRMDDPEAGEHVLRLPIAAHAMKEAEEAVRQIESIRLVAERTPASSR